MQVQSACFNEFPDQCKGCPEYSETRQNQTAQFLWLAGITTMYPPPYLDKVVKECKRFHKRKVEYLR